MFGLLGGMCEVEFLRLCSGPLIYRSIKCVPLDHPLDYLVINTSRTVLSFFVCVQFLSYEHLLRIVQVYLSSVLCPVDLLPFLLYGHYLPEPVWQMTTSIVHSMSQCTLVCLPHSCGSFGGKTAKCLVAVLSF